MTDPSGPSHYETERLRLVRPRLADADAVFARYANDPEVTRYLGWPRHRTVEDTRAFIAWSDDHWAHHPVGPYLIRDRADGRLLGGSGFTCDDEGGAMTGYVLAQDAWGRGVATEALMGILDIARRTHVSSLYAFCHPEHRASVRVLEKCGFILDDSAVTTMTFPNLDGGVEVEALRYRRWC